MPCVSLTRAIMTDNNIYIKSFKIKNFRRFDHVDLSFDDHLYTALVGRNSTGKTSILEALNICLSENSSKFNTIKETDFYSDKPIEFEVEFNSPFFLAYPDYSFNRLLPCYKFRKVISRRKQKAPEQLFSSPYAIAWQYELHEYDRLTRPQYKKTWGDPYKELISSNSHIVWSLKRSEARLGEEGYEFTIATDPDMPRIIKPFELASLDKKELYPRVFYFDKDRDRELESQYRTAFSNIASELDWRYRRKLLKDNNKEPLSQSFDTLHKEFSELDNHKEELLKPALSMLRDDFKLDFNIQNLEFFFFDLNQPYRNTIFGHKTDNDQIVSVSNCGSGIAILVSLAILIAFAKESKENIIVLIDEPELHLHSNLQKNLLHFLKRQDFQAVISTHSHLFLDKQGCGNNVLIELDDDGNIIYKRCNQIELADVQFRLLGNSLEDLFIPENLILVEGKYDRNIITRALELRSASDIALQILDCGGKEQIANKADKYDAVMKDILSGDMWFHKYLKKHLRIVADGDISVGKIDGWKQSYELEDDQVYRLRDEQTGMEYLFPESLVKACVDGCTLKDGISFGSKSKDEVVAIILNDERLGMGKQDQWLQNPDQRVSKQRLNSHVVQNINLDILNDAESSDLKNLIDWIMSPIRNGAIDTVPEQ